MNRTALRALAAAGVATLAVSAAAPALASSGDGRVERTGSCSGSTDWKLKAKPDNGRLEVEGEVDSNKNGQTWKWKILHDGDVSYRGKATTRGPSGSFSIERRVVNSPGTDRIGFRAHNPNTGETCTGSLGI